MISNKSRDHIRGIISLNLHPWIFHYNLIKSIEEIPNQGNKKKQGTKPKEKPIVENIPGKDQGLKGKKTNYGKKEGKKTRKTKSQQITLRKC